MSTILRFISISIPFFIGIVAAVGGASSSNYNGPFLPALRIPRTPRGSQRDWPAFIEMVKEASRGLNKLDYQRNLVHQLRSQVATDYVDDEALFVSFDDHKRLYLDGKNLHFPDNDEVDIQIRESGSKCAAMEASFKSVIQDLKSHDENLSTSILSAWQVKSSDERIRVSLQNLFKVGEFVDEHNRFAELIYSKYDKVGMKDIQRRVQVIHELAEREQKRLDEIKRKLGTVS